MVSLKLDSSLNPIDVATSAHACGYHRPWSTVARYWATPGLSTHLVIHVGRGSQANYFSANRKGDNEPSGRQRLDCDGFTDFSHRVLYDVVAKFDPSRDVLVAPAGTQTALASKGWSGSHVRSYSVGTAALRLSNAVQPAAFQGFWGQAEYYAGWTDYGTLGQKKDWFWPAGRGPDGLTAPKRDEWFHPLSPWSNWKTDIP